MDIQIRDAQPGDADDMTALLGELFSIEADFSVDKQRQRRGLFLLLDGCLKHRCVKVAQADGRVVGMVTAQMLISTAQGGMVALVEDMVVAARFQGRGIGRMLMEHLEAWARKHGASRLQLLADAQNHPALTFYNRLGWQSTQLVGLRKYL